MKQQNETTRQQKIASVILRDLSNIFIKEMSDVVSGALITVTKVRVSPDLSLAKVYISIFPFDKHQQIIANIKVSTKKIRFELAKKVKSQLRIVPELAFFVDDSLEYVDNIEKLLK